MSDEEFVTHEQVDRWLPADVRRALNPHEHCWVELSTMDRPDVLQVCTVSGCDEQQWVPR